MRKITGMLALLLGLAIVLIGCESSLLAPPAGGETEATPSLTVSVLPAVGTDSESRDVGSDSSRALLSADKIVVTVTNTVDATDTHTKTVIVSGAPAGSNFDFVLSPGTSGTTYDVLAEIMQDTDGDGTVEKVLEGTAQITLWEGSYDTATVYPVPVTGTTTVLTEETASGPYTVSPSSYNDTIEMPYGGDELWFQIDNFSADYLELSLTLTEEQDDGIVVGVFDKNGGFVGSMAANSGFNEIFDVSWTAGAPFYVGVIGFELSDWHGMDVRVGWESVWLHGPTAASEFTITYSSASAPPAPNVVGEYLDWYNDSTNRQIEMQLGTVEDWFNFGHIIEFDDGSNSFHYENIQFTGTSNASVVSIDSTNQQITAAGTGTAIVDFTSDYDATTTYSATITVYDFVSLVPGDPALSGSVSAGNLARYELQTSATDFDEYTITTTSTDDVDLFVYDQPNDFGSWTSHESATLDSGNESVTIGSNEDYPMTSYPVPVAAKYVYVATTSDTAVSFTIEATSSSFSFEPGGSSTFGDIADPALRAYDPTGAYRDYDDYLGSTAGIEGVLAGVFDMAGVSRALDPTESTAGATLTPIAFSPYVVVVNDTDMTNITNLSGADLAAVLDGTYVDWSSAASSGSSGPITVYSFEMGTDTYSFVSSMLGTSIAADQFFWESETLDLIDAVTSTPGSIAVVPWIDFQMFNSDLTGYEISIESFEPTVTNIQAGDYPAVQPLGIVTNGTPGGEVASFITYLTGTDGTALIENLGFVPVP